MTLMKMRGILIIQFVPFCFQACFTVAPKRTDSDGFGSISLDQFSFKIIELENDFSIFKDNKTLYLFASWCAPCLGEIKFGKKYDSSNTYFISTNYNIKSVAKELSLKTDTLYILSNKFYGSNEKAKIKNFSSSLLKTEQSLEGLPQRFENSNGNFLRISLE